MTIRIVNSVKYVGLFTLILLSIVACEKDFENIGVGLVDNNQFETKVETFEIIAYNRNVDSSRVDGIPQYLLGIYKDDNFGLIKASYIGQVGLTTPLSFGENVSIDAVVLDIPYYVTRDTNNVNGTPDFILDSIIGDQNLEYNLSVYELGTFLNTLDPQDPSKAKKYYSDEEYSEKTLLYTGAFKPNKNDTVLYVNRNFIDDDPLTTDDIDTIKKSTIAPTIKIPLDTTFFRNNFINQQNSGAFDSFENFIDYFRGIIIKPEGTDGSIMTMALTDAAITIYYTNTILFDETDTDLNGDGDTNDVDVPIRTKQNKEFTLSSTRSGQYVRDYSGSEINDYLVNPDKINGEDKLFVQGAAGSISVLELFKGIDLDEIRDQNWLINDANITLYIDNETAQNTLPEQLYLYKVDQNSQILDVFTETQTGSINGLLVRDEDNNPTKYKFSITDYISEVLKYESLDKARLGIKVYHATDFPLTLNDTIVKNFSWKAKGVVLKGNNRNLTDNEKLKLEIFYTVINE